MRGVLNELKDLGVYRLREGRESRRKSENGTMRLRTVRTHSTAKILS